MLFILLTSADFYNCYTIDTYSFLPRRCNKMAEEYLESIMEQLPKLDAVKLGELIDRFQVPITSARGRRCNGECDR